ncbi:glycoside hydrolase family 16 protein [bacterium]|nr:glycoside hydrolase family 16 protein [bacterium]
MFNKININLFIAIIFLFSFAKNSYGQYETDWPQEGYNAYFTDNGNEVLLRDSQNNCVGKMILTIPWLAQSDNIAQSFVYKEKYGGRWIYIDVNKNGIIDNIFYDDFSAYEFVDNPDLPPLDNPYNIFGYQQAGFGISKGLHAYFDSIEKTGEDIPYVAMGIYSEDFDTPMDFQDCYILVDIKTEGIDNAVEKVFTPMIHAKVLYNPVIEHQSWRLQNYPYQISEKNNPTCLYPLPSSHEGTMLSFNINDLVHTDIFPGQTGDFSDVISIGFLFLQCPLDSSGTRNDWDEKGSMNIKSISISKDAKLKSTTPLDTEIIISNVQADSFKPKNKVTVSVDIFKKGDVAQTITDIMVYNSTFDFSNTAASKIYDSSVSGGSAETHIGLGEIETVIFSFYLPENAMPGNYRIMGIIKDAQGGILDTTGPDKSLDDRTILAYTESFTVTSFNQEGPVPLFDYFITDQGAGNVSVILYANMSYNYPSGDYEIIRYEWDIDNDGVFEYGSASPVQPVFFTSVDNSFIKPVALRVTNNRAQAQSAVTSKNIRIGRFGDLEINTSLLDNDSTANAKCLLYDAEHNYIGEKIVNSSSTALWNNLLCGDYIVEIYVYKNGLFPSVELACAKKISVTAGEKSSYTLTEPVLKILSVSMRYEDTNELLNPSDILYAGTNLKLDITVRNNSVYDLYARLKLVADRDRQGLFDIDVKLSDKVYLPSGEQGVISTFFNPQEPDDDRNKYDIDTFYYAFMLEIEKNLIPVKVYEQTWQEGFHVKQLPSRLAADSINFCGVNFDVVRTRRFSGIIENNVSFTNDIDYDGNRVTFDSQGVLNLKVQDYSGVGAEVTSHAEIYHYGIYKAQMKVNAQGTTLPEGTVLGFFHYWETNSETQLQEIDVELRSLDKSQTESVSYAAFTVHSRKQGDSSIHFITHFCPVENIGQYHTYEFRWKYGEVAFYIDGLPAYNFNGEPAVVNELSIDNKGQLFTGRIPDQPGRLIINHWSGYWNNTWSGAAPQGKGDSIAKIARIAYIDFNGFNRFEGLNIIKNNENKVEIKLKKGSWPIGCDIYCADTLTNPLEWTLLETNVSLSEYKGYTDNTSDEENLKYYKVIPK